MTLTQAAGPFSTQWSIPFDRTLMAWMVAGARVTGMMLTAPFLGSTGVPARVKAGCAVVLTLLLAPLVPGPLAALSGAAAFLLFVREMAAGAILGLTLQVFLEAARVAGQVCGVQMGYALASVLNPDSPADSTVLATFYELAALLLFLQLGVPEALLRGLARSFVYLPPGHLVLAWPAVEELLRLAGGMFVAGLQMAAPVLVATLFADVALGFIGKASTQLPVLFIGISLKNLLGLALLCGVVGFWPRFFEARFARALDAGEKILQLAK